MGDNLRKLTGTLQLLGAGGLLTGLIFSIPGFIGAAGLSLMMLIAFATRIRVRDAVIQSLPSFFFMLLNGYLAYLYMELILKDL